MQWPQEVVALLVIHHILTQSKNTTFDVVEEETPKVQKGQNEDISHEFYNNEVLSFPTRNHKPSVDEQLKKFVEII